MLRRTLVGAGLLALLLGVWRLDASRPGAPAFALAALGTVLALGALDELFRLRGPWNSTDHAPRGPTSATRRAPRGARLASRLVGGAAGAAWLALFAAYGLGAGGLVPHAAAVGTAASLATGVFLVLGLRRGPSPALGRLALRAWFALPWVGGLGCLLSLLCAGRLDFVGGLVVVAKSSDIGAYFAGKSLGRRKLIPSVSPGKTVEGALGGLLLPALVGGLLLDGVETGLPGEPTVVLPGGVLGAALHGLVVGAITIVSDLGESLVKRSLDVKDSGTLFGESGGFLDVADSLLFLAPLGLAYTALLSFCVLGAGVP